nr:hypothetical protein CFP56_53370 [Quercus suber]
MLADGSGRMANGCPKQVTIVTIRVHASSLAEKAVTDEPCLLELGNRVVYRLVMRRSCSWCQLTRFAKDLQCTPWSRRTGSAVDDGHEDINFHPLRY